MSETHQSNTAPAPARRWFTRAAAYTGEKIIVVVKKVPAGLHMTLIVASWIIPGIIIGIGALTIAIVTIWLPPWAATLIALFAQLVLTVIFVYWETYYVTHRNTSNTQLQMDSVGSIVLMGLLLFIGGGLLFTGSFPWYYLIPLIGSVWDALQTAFLGINNAAEKPYVSPKGSS